MTLALGARFLGGCAVYAEPAPHGFGRREYPRTSRRRLNAREGGRGGEGMIWRSRIRPWVAAAIVIVLAGGLFWMAVKHAEKSGAASSSAGLGEAMSKAAHQRVLTP
jgi:hypothetical protein